MITIAAVVVVLAIAVRVGLRFGGRNAREMYRKMNEDNE